MGGSALYMLLAAGLGVGVASCGGDDRPAEPERFPVIGDLGGPHMAHPQLVPIFFADDVESSTSEEYARFMVASRWLLQVGEDYGVGAGSVPGVVHLTEQAPDAISDAQIADLVFARIADGTLPQPTSPDLLYMLYFPQHTVISLGGDTSCADFGGYHLSARRNGVELAYAVIATCDLLNTRDMVASHELIEAATDPYPDNHPGFQLADPTDPWRALGAEVADLCERGDSTDRWSEGSHQLQRSWSIKSAAAGFDPCIPNFRDPYYSVTADVPSVPRIAPGGHLSIPLRGWASGAEPPTWQLSASPGRDDQATVKLGATASAIDSTTTLDVTVSSNTPAGTFVRLFVFSFRDEDSFYQVMPMFAAVGDPCSTATTCEACSSRAGCGFCSSSGRCEALGETSCPAKSLATQPGSCRGFCASHGGNCLSCASLPGCGWCETGGAPQCIEAAPDDRQPVGGTCAYADWAAAPNYCPR